MAEVRLLPRKAFEIDLESGTVRGQYSFWVTVRLCQRNGWSMSQLDEKMNADNLTLSDVVTLLLCAIEYSCRKDKIPFTYTDIDVADIIEELGGITGDNFLKVWGHSKTDLPSTENEEKKSMM